MPAAITSAGTWTLITGLTTTGMSSKFANNPRAEGLNFEGLKTADGVILDEIRQFIQLAADAYGISHWAAADLISVLMRAYRSSATPRQLGGATGGALFTN